MRDRFETAWADGFNPSFRGACEVTRPRRGGKNHLVTLLVMASGGPLLGCSRNRSLVGRPFVNLFGPLAHGTEAQTRPSNTMGAQSWV